eukprot:scaffold7599_cov248-Pinguiococcus_pyrenoidosus.AAC.1
MLTNLCSRRRTAIATQHLQQRLLGPADTRRARPLVALQCGLSTRQQASAAENRSDFRVRHSPQAAHHPPNSPPRHTGRKAREKSHEIGAEVGSPGTTRSRRPVAKPGRWTESSPEASRAPRAQPNRLHTTLEPWPPKEGYFAGRNAAFWLRVNRIEGEMWRHESSRFRIS